MAILKQGSLGASTMGRVRGLALVAVVWLWVGVVAGQDAPALPFNSPQTGEVNDEVGERWAFSAATNGIYSVYVEPLDSDLDPIVSIEDNLGRVLISNDDYDYPNSRSAFVEGVTINNFGTYYVRVEGFGGTRGNYRVMLYNGYGRLVFYENFNGDLTWDIISAPVVEVEDDDTDGDETEAEAEARISAGGAFLNVTGIQEELILRANESLDADFYATVTIRDVEGQNGWQVGFIVRLQDDANFIGYLIDQRGYWRVFERRDGADRILRDWSAHPAITAGVTDFTLGVLAYGDAVELFYNDALVGTVTAPLEAGGDVGIMIRTVNALNSQTQAVFDDFVVSVPALMTPPEAILRGSGNAGIRYLQRQRLIPPGGFLFLNLDEITIQNATAGIRRFPLVSGSVFSDFALGAEITWSGDSRVVGGCGMVVHDAVEHHAYGLVFADNEGGYSIAERSGDDFLTQFFQIDEALGFPYRLVLISKGGELLVYINEVYRGSMTMQRSQGGIGTATINYEPTLTTCQYRNLWVWKPE